MQCPSPFKQEEQCPVGEQVDCDNKSAATCISLRRTGGQKPDLLQNQNATAKGLAVRHLYTPSLIEVNFGWMCSNPSVSHKASN